jgi:hypothetical protein
MKDNTSKVIKLAVVLLVLMTTTSPSLPPNVSAQDQVVALKGERGVRTDPDGDATTSRVLATSNPDEWCGECLEWDQYDNCIRRQYHQPENPTNCYCGGAWGNCVWWALYTRRDIIGANWESIETDWDNRPYDWDSYAEQTGYPVSAVPKLGAIAVFDPYAVSGVGELGHVASMICLMTIVVLQSAR